MAVGDASGGGGLAMFCYSAAGVLSLINKEMNRREYRLQSLIRLIFHKANCMLVGGRILPDADGEGRPRSRHHGWVIAFSLLLFCDGSYAQESNLNRVIVVSIDSGPLGPALTALSTQAGVQIIAASARVDALFTPGVHGMMTLSQALSALLKGTALSFYLDGPSTVSVGEPRPDISPHSTFRAPNLPALTSAGRSEIAGGSSGSQSTQNNERGDTVKRKGLLSRIFGIFVLCSAATMATHPACAQSTSSADTGPGASTDQLQEVVVTASKREEDLQRVPVTVTAVTNAEIQDLRITNGFDITKLTPNMYVDTVDGDRSAPRYNIRGVGSNDATVEAGMSVGVYADGIFLNNIMAASMAVFDENRIEVLRGPQGTLWGKNTTAGTVNFVSNGPTQTLEGYGRVGYGNFDAKEAEGAISGPVADNLAARVSFFASDRDGEYQNVVTTNKDGGFTDYAVRAQLLWTPTDTLKFLTIANVRDLNEVETYFIQGLNANGTNFEGDKENPRSTVTQTDFDQPFTLSIASLTQHVDWTAANGINLTSDTGYVKTRPVAITDGDGSPQQAANTNTQQHINQWSEELRLSSRSDEPLRWMLGGYFLGEALHSYQTNTSGNLTANADLLRLIDQGTQSRALFGNVDFDFLGKMNARLGARFTNESKNISILAYQFTGNPFNVFYAPATLGPLTTSLADRVTQTKVTWDATLDYNMTPTKMAYLRIATGFKASEFGTGLLGTVVPPGFAAKPENIVDYELGTKTSWVNNRLQFNADAFYYYYTDYQVATVSGVIGSTTGASLTLSNARSASVTGVESDITALPFDNLLLRLSGGWDNAHFIDFNNAMAPSQLNSGLPLDVSGQRLPRAPTGTASAMVQYTIPLNGDRDLQLQTDWNYVGNTNFDVWVDSNNVHPQAAFVALVPAMKAAFYEPAYALGNAAVAMRWGAQHDTKLSFWVKNLTDKFYRLNRYQDFSLGEAVVYRGDERTYGVSFEHNFAAGK